MKTGLTLLFMTWCFIAITWFFPKFIKRMARVLFVLGETSEWLHRRLDRRGKPGPKPKAPAPAVVAPQMSKIQTDLVDALISQGAPKLKAKAIVAQLPPDVSFQRGFQIASQELRKAA